MKRLFAFLLVGLLAFVLPTDARPSLVPETLTDTLDAAAERAAHDARQTSRHDDGAPSQENPNSFIQQLTQQDKNLLQAQYIVVEPKNIPVFRQNGFSTAQEITWEEFEKQLNVLQDQYAEEQTNLLEAEQDFSRFISAGELVSLIQTPKDGLPDYGQLTQGKKYVYIAESGAHNTHTMPQEGVRILKQVRAANPKARILLALEMAMLTEQVRSPLLSFRRTENPDYVYILPEYLALSDTAKSLQIDSLALDDFFAFKTTPADTYLVKMGAYAVRFNTTDPLIQEFTREYGPEYTDDPVGVVYDVLSRSSWGVQQRNNQWVRYIQAVKDSYDIIIFYAGNGHLLPSISYSVPNLIGQDGILLTLVTEEQLPDDVRQFADCVRDIQCKHNLSPEYNAAELTSYEQEVWNEKGKQFIPFLQQLEQQKPFWVDYATDNEIEKLLLPKIPAQYQEQFTDKTGVLLPGSFKWAEIYLPEKQ